MLRRSAGRLTAFGVIAASMSIVPAAASAASSQRNACYTATTFRSVSGPSACRGAEAFITWARHGLTRNGEVTGGTRPRNQLTVKGDLGSHGPFISTRTVRGASGIAGLKGVQGDSGAQGPKGDSGAAGAAGDPGQQGSQGEQGLRGVSGETGPRGETGATGAAGAKGDPGEQGIQGTAGLTGAVGAAGVAGADGLTGAIGLSGPQGAEGPAGPQGIQGVPGGLGVQGPAGADGGIGPQGLPGANGPVGPAGPQGPAGVLNGFRRTVPDPITLLVSATPVASLTPAAGAYFGSAMTTITGLVTTPASVTCTVNDRGTDLGTVVVKVGGDAGPLTAKAQIQLGMFTASGSMLVYACTSDVPDAAVASGTLVAGLSLDAIPESP